VRAWSLFRQSLGLIDPPQVLNERGASTEDGKEFQYVLLTGKDAELASQAPEKRGPTLRYGSSGAATRYLQGALASANVGYTAGAHGQFDRDTMGAVAAVSRASCALDMILVLIPTIHATTFWLAPYQAPASHVRRAKRAACSRPLSWVRTHGAANRCDIADPSVGSTNGSYQQSLRLSQLASCRQALHAM
jgi:hypothetical protein